jgi:hypothetical protein
MKNSIYLFRLSFLNSIVLYNPSVINTLSFGASIQNFRAEVILFPNQNYNTNQILGNTEIIGNYTVYTGGGNSYYIY